jgi:deferrochelatase/peroxidase EfeB
MASLIARLSAAAAILGVGASSTTTVIGGNNNNTTTTNGNDEQNHNTTEQPTTHPQRKLQTSPITPLRENTLILTISLKKRANWMRATKNLAQAIVDETIQLNEQTHTNNNNSNNTTIDTAMGVSPRVWSKIRESVPTGISIVSTDFEYPQAFSPSREDLCVHVKADHKSHLISLAQRVIESMNPEDIHEIRDQYGFRLAHGKNWDGMIMPRNSQHVITKLPIPQTNKLNRASQIALIPDIGGSFLLIQKWEMNPTTMSNGKNVIQFNAEKIIGRSMDFDHQPYTCMKSNTGTGGFVDLDKNPHLIINAVKSGSIPNNSHVSRMFLLDPTGQKIEIERQSVCTGTLTNKQDPLGVLYVCYSNDSRVLKIMMERMMGTFSQDKTKDALLSRYQLKGGQLYYVLSPDQLASLVQF